MAYYARVVVMRKELPPEPARSPTDDLDRDDRVSNPARYRRYAAHCIEMAKAVDLPTDKASLLDMAEAWRRLADHVEVFSKHFSDYGDRLSEEPSDPS
jgi:hypothetical protein